MPQNTRKKKINNFSFYIHLGIDREMNTKNFIFEKCLGSAYLLLSASRPIARTAHKYTSSFIFLFFYFLMGNKFIIFRKYKKNSLELSLWERRKERKKK